jgi:cell division protein FtsA
VRREHLVAGLNLGTTKTCAVIAEAVPLDGAAGARVLGIGLARTSGVKSGKVRDIEETTRSIVRAMRDAERMAGVAVPAVYCGIAGEHVRTQTSTGLASVTGEEITREDAERVEDVAKAVTLGEGYELLHFIPQEYKVDAQGGISDPVGFVGLRLEVEMCLVAVQSKAAQNVRKSVERAGYRVAELVLEPLAAALATLTEEEKELGCALVELGGGLTTTAIFHDGKLRHLSSLPFAGWLVTSDIVQGLGVTQSDAERLKERFGVAYTPLVSTEETIELPGTPGQGAREAKRELLAHIIHQRLDEILGLVLEQIEHAGFGGRLPAGVVLTGGGAHMAGIVELAREVFAMPVRKGVPQAHISGLVDSVQAPRYAVPVGLALYAARQRLRLGGSADTSVGKLLAPVKRWLQDFF